MDVRDQIRLFLERVQGLRREPLLREAGSEFEISWKRGEPTEIRWQQPDEVYLRSYLLTFRQFFLNDEPVYFYRIHNIAYQHLRSDYLREKLAKCREGWKKSLESSGLRLHIDGQEITPERAMHLLIYGDYFKSDYEKRELLKTFGPMEKALTKQQFLNLIADTTGQLVTSAEILSQALNAGLVDN